MMREVTWGKLRQVRGLLALLIVIFACFGERVARGQDGEALELPEIVNLVFTNSPYAFFKGFELPSDPIDSWQKPGFDDSAWFQKLYTPFSYGESLLQQNRVGFELCYGLFEHVEEFFRKISHGDERLEFEGDFLGSILSTSECLAQCVDLDFSEYFFDRGLSIEEDLHVVRILEVSDQRGFSEHRAKHAA